MEKGGGVSNLNPVVDHDHTFVQSRRGVSTRQIMAIESDRPVQNN